MDDAALVRDGERLGDGVQELDDGRQRSAATAPRRARGASSTSRHSPSSHSSTVYGTQSPRDVVSDETSRAWQMEAHRSERSISKRPSSTKLARSCCRASSDSDGRGERLDGDAPLPDAVRGPIDHGEGGLRDDLARRRTCRRSSSPRARRDRASGSCHGLRGSDASAMFHPRTGSSPRLDREATLVLAPHEGAFERGHRPFARSGQELRCGLGIHATWGP